MTVLADNLFQFPALAIVTVSMEAEALSARSRLGPHHICPTNCSMQGIMQECVFSMAAFTKDMQSSVA